MMFWIVLGILIILAIPHLYSIEDFIELPVHWEDRIPLHRGQCIDIIEGKDYYENDIRYYYEVQS